MTISVALACQPFSRCFPSCSRCRQAERAQAHQTLLPLVQNPQLQPQATLACAADACGWLKYSRCMPQLQFVLAHTSSGGLSKIKQRKAARFTSCRRIYKLTVRSACFDLRGNRLDEGVADTELAAPHQRTIPRQLITSHWTSVSDHQKEEMRRESRKEMDTRGGKRGSWRWKIVTADAGCISQNYQQMSGLQNHT